jgi:ribonuclease R
MQIDSNEILNVLAAADHALGVREVMGRLSINPGALTEMKRHLRDMVRDGLILKDGKRYRPATDKGRELPVPKRLAKRGEPGPVTALPKPVLIYKRDPEGKRKGSRGGPKTIIGALKKHRDGYGFVERYDSEGDDVFVPAVEAAQAFDGDLVRVEVIPGTAGRTQGRIVETVERRRQYALGTYIARGKQVYVQPMDQALGETIAVRADDRFKDGEIVKVRLLQAGAPGFVPPQGEVLEKAGEPGDPKLEVLRAAYSQGFDDQFPQNVIDEAHLVAVPVKPADLGGKRRDVRDLRLVTIDGEDARDFDDAIFVERASNGGYRLVVAIADVSHYVTEGSALDDEALRRTTSVYFPNAVLPMLPEALSNDICSLRPDEDRLCMVADMLLDAQGMPASAELYAGVMRSRARCTYTEVATLLSGEKVPSREFIRADLTLAWELARKLNQVRIERGSIDFDIAESKVVLDGKGGVKGFEKRPRNDAHRLIEECMLAANEAVARHFADRDAPTLYRVHAIPDADKLDLFMTFAGTHGLSLPPGTELTPKALNALLAQIAGKPQQRAFNSLLLRAMMQATYDAENIGHYGLAAENYLHFTSPIRRYPDLIVHRLLKEEWARGKVRDGEAQTERLAAIAKRCSERERAAMKAEREVDNFFGCLYLKDKIGERHPGIVASVTDFGAFVELEDLFVEGLVKAEDLGGEAELDLATQTLAFATGKKLTVGDRIEVQIRSVNLERRQTDLVLVEAGRIVRDGDRPKTLSEAIDRMKGKGRRGDADDRHATGRSRSKGEKRSSERSGRGGEPQPQGHRSPGTPRTKHKPGGGGGGGGGSRSPRRGR